MERFILKNWLTELTKKGVEENSITAECAEKLKSLEESTNDNSLYKLTKYILLFTALILILLGVGIILGDALKKSGSILKIMSLLPFIVGTGVYGYYKSSGNKSKLIKEVATTFFFVTSSITLFTFFPAFEIDSIDIIWQIYACLGLGLYLINTEKTVSTAIMYFSVLSIPAVISFLPLIASMSGMRGLRGGIPMEALGPEYTNYLLWGFLIGGAFICKEFVTGNNNGKISRAILGWQFGSAAITFASTLTGGLTLLGTATMLPIIYILGKKYYSNGTWFFYRPLQTLVIYSVVASTMVYSTKVGVEQAIGMDVLGDSWKLHQIIGLLLVGAMGYFAYTLYQEEVETDNVKVNLLIFGFSALLVITSLFGWFGWSWYSFLFTFYGIILGVTYLNNGLDNKYTPLIILGTITLVPIVIIKIVVNGDIFGANAAAYIIGLLLIGIGVGIALLVKYMKENWSVTGALIKSNELDDVIDNKSEE